MVNVTLGRSRRGLAGFPRGFTPVGRDETGDPLAVDEEGRVWSFLHGAGNWESKTLAFASLTQLRDYVAFLPEFLVPENDDAAALRARIRRITAFGKQQRGAPFVRPAVAAVLEELRQRLAERQFAASKRGQRLQARQALGQRCEAALRAAGVPGSWLVRPHVDEKKTLVVIGPFASPWSEARIVALLAPVVGDAVTLRCRVRP
ncbi:MAG: hypothetical protein IPK26_27235 [Planctomycetes bacterium]|nr:hypothetical protein [Planctomycetota bacterium]